MSFEDDYPHLASFFMSYFPPGEYDYASEEEAIRAEVVPGFGFEAVVKEGHSLLAETDLPWQEIANCASRMFNGAEEARLWLSQIIAWVEEELKNGNDKDAHEMSVASCRLGHSIHPGTSR